MGLEVCGAPLTRYKRLLRLHFLYFGKHFHSSN